MKSNNYPYSFYAFEDNSHPEIIKNMYGCGLIEIDSPSYHGKSVNELIEESNDLNIDEFIEYLIDNRLVIDILPKKVNYNFLCPVCDNYTVKETTCKYCNTNN